MIPIPALILCAVFLAFSAVHLRWLLGGHSGLEGVVPTRDGKPLLQPGKGSTLLVSLALLVAALVCLWRGACSHLGPAWVPRLGIWVLAVVFALRAIGDFRYLGFFKSVRDTKIARNDSLFLSPLCMAISFLAAWLALGC